MVSKGKKRKSKEAGDDEEQEMVMIDKSTSLYVKCRNFIGLSTDQLKEFIEKQGITVKAVSKPNKKEYGFVDIGESEKIEEYSEKLKNMQYKGAVIVADRVKENKELAELNKNKEPKPNQTIEILDRLLCVRGLTKFVSKRTLMDVFKKVESVIIPSSKGNFLRDALVIFHNPDQVTKAIEEFQGWELGGGKLKLERLTSIPISDTELTIKHIETNITKDKKEDASNKKVKSESLETEENSDNKNVNKSNKSLKNAKQKNKTKKKNENNGVKGENKDNKDDDADNDADNKVEPPKKKQKN